MEFHRATCIAILIAMTQLVETALIHHLRHLRDLERSKRAMTEVSKDAYVVPENPNPAFTVGGFDMGRCPM